MKIIDDMIEHVMEEIEGAMEYAEKSIEAKARGSARSAQYRDMALQEHNHATILRDFAIQDVEDIKRIHPLTVEEEEHWHHCLRRISEKLASVKTLLS